MPSRLEDPPVKVGFADNHFVRTPGGGGTAEVSEKAIYLTMSLRNVGNGIAVLHGWRPEPSSGLGAVDRPPLEEFHRLTRDLYIAVGDVAFWQGALRDPNEPEFADLADKIAAGERVVIDVLYGDQHGGQRVISRFSMLPRSDQDGWLVTVARHWNVDRPDPR
jgi:hypothetical protein